MLVLLLQINMIKKFLRDYFSAFDDKKEVTENGIIMGTILIPISICLVIIYCPLYYFAKWLNR